MLALSEVIFRGPAVSDERFLQSLPPVLVELLRSENGFVAFGGGLHVRGVCAEPAWHSLQQAMIGPRAIHRLFTSVRASDVPFGEDCVGDQFVLRGDEVLVLDAEQDRLHSMGLDLDGFLAAAERDPENFLAMHPLLRLRREGQAIGVGTLISVYPPFVFDYRGARTVKPVAVPDRLSYLSDLARQLSTLSDGAQVQVVVKA